MKTSTKALHPISNSKQQQLRVRTVSTTATTVLAWVPPLSLAPTARNSLSHCEWWRHYQSLKLLKTWFCFPLYYSSFFRFVALNIYCQPTLMLGESYVGSSFYFTAAVQCRLHDTSISITLNSCLQHYCMSAHENCLPFVVVNCIINNQDLLRHWAPRFAAQQEMEVDEVVPVISSSTVTSSTTTLMALFTA